MRDPGTRRARARTALAAAVILIATAGWAAATPPDGPRVLHPYSANLPRGPGSLLAQRSCVLCHSAMLITQQHKDSTAWDRTLATMQKWGAPLTPSERDTLRGYLLARFGPRAPR